MAIPRPMAPPRKETTAVQEGRGAWGHVVFPATTGDNLFLLAAAGVLFFREKLGPF
jgi:hypothetical protein